MPTKNSATKKAPRMSAGAARAEGAAKTKRALAEARATTEANLKAIAAADQENAAKRDERASSNDALTASERAVVETKSGPPAAQKPRIRTGRKAENVATPGTPGTPATPRRRSALDAAATVLAASDKAMRASELIAAMCTQGLWRSPGGQTPNATLYAAMVREIARKGGAARFRKVERGLFASARKGE